MIRNSLQQGLISELGGDRLGNPKISIDPNNTAVAQTYIDFTKSLAEMAVDTIVYFRSGQYLLDAISVLVPPANAPKDEKEAQATVGAARLHDLLNNIGTAGLDAADMINGGVYLMEGDAKMAALCMVAAIPVVGGAVAKAKVGKFAISAAESAAMDASIAELKAGLKKTGEAAADDTIREISKIRSDMNSGTADFEPYAKMSEERKQAAAAVAQDPNKLEAAKASLTRQQKAYEDLRALAKQNLKLPEGDPQRYAGSLPTSGPEWKIDFPDGRENGTVGDALSPGRHEAGVDLLIAWERNADHNFFNEEVKKVHWLGFSKSERSRTAIQALQDFLDDAPVSKGVQISTAGYLGDLNPGPRAGVSFSEGLEGAQVQVGIKLRGDTTYATTGDAFTTNRGDKIKSQIAAAKAGQSTAPVFYKVPRAATVEKRFDPKFRSDILRAQSDAAELASKNPGSHWSDYMDKSWDEVSMAFPPHAGGPTDLMLDRGSWRESFSDGKTYNEVVLDNWEPEAIILNPKSATLEQIEQFKRLADKRGLPLLDMQEKPINLDDFVQLDRSHAPARTAADPRARSTLMSGNAIERIGGNSTPPSDTRSTMYESARHRWGTLAGLLKG